MIDVHPPHKAIGNKSEFFLHLFTITIGLLIAVGIEGCVGRYEHHELAVEARQTMTAEIRKNAKQVGEALAEIEQEQKKNADELAGVQKVQSNPNDASNGNLNINISYNFVGLEDTAWKTAQATGALAFMPYAEAERYSDIYGAEQVLLREQDQIAEDDTQLIGAVQGEADWRGCQHHRETVGNHRGAFDHAEACSKGLAGRTKCLSGRQGRTAPAVGEIMKYGRVAWQNSRYWWESL